MKQIAPALTAGKAYCEVANCGMTKKGTTANTNHSATPMANRVSVRRLMLCRIVSLMA